MIAVTGATGLLGQMVIQQLTTAGIRVRALSRKKVDADRNNHQLVEWYQADILDPVSLHDSLAPVEGVIHAAALVSFNPRHRKQLYYTNVLGTRNVVNACLSLGIRRLTHISSVAALGRTKNQSLIDEDNPWTDSSLNSYYAESKYYAELEVFRAQEEGLSTVILNPSVILSRGDWNNSSARLFRYAYYQIPFYIDGTLNYVDGRDVAALAVQLHRSSVEGERFIASAGSISFREFFEQVAECFQRKPPRIRVSGLALHLLSGAEYIRSWLGGDPIITRETARLAGSCFTYDNRKIRNCLGFTFQSLTSTLEWCCSYYLQQAKNQNNR